MSAENISVVIICKNAVDTITQTIASALRLTNDVVVVDSGSTDGTMETVINTSARLERIEWKGYGTAKNFGNRVAFHDWIFSLDSDEELDEQLIASIRQSSLHEATVFTMQRLNYLGGKPIYFGEWRNDIVLRLFNRNNAEWNTAPVHEELILKGPVKKVRLAGKLHHYTSPGIEDYKLKLNNYAKLNAEKYYQRGKKPHWYKTIPVSPG
jgi:glycosyltransferase involved in cell wall biosynthesis